ncbi:metallophosphoesterase [Paraburkholderia sp. SUR17]|uniref:metallophosphoesterase family protein n=1 Tax=Paraburkholderia sp. SUR17 TaxID=3034358 RepID=UPI0024088872|nr:metallophosphoesterase [Paraburkholderia sp. SUR17]WEY41391.1 metallophosphoesterase [Paraburkholderia sp. SUR17]
MNDDKMPDRAPARMDAGHGDDLGNPPGNLTGHGKARRRALTCMAWAGTGVVWTLSGGVPRTLGIVGDAWGATSDERALTFVQISDSHIGFNKQPNPAPENTLQEAIDKIKALPRPPAFMLHTGDVSQLSRPAEFDTAEQIVRGAGLDVHYIPGEHDVLIDDGQPFFERFSKGTGGKGWYSFDQNGVHFVALVNVLNLKSGGLGSLGAEQLAWLERDLRGRTSSTPIVVFTHIPLWSLYPEWGWGTDDSAQALGYLKRFGSVTVLNGHIHQVLQKVEGNVSFHSAMSTAFPIAAPGVGPGPGPMKVPEDRLHAVLGVRTVNFVPGRTDLALVDSPLGA